MKLRKIGDIKRRSKKSSFSWTVLIIILFVGYGFYWLVQNSPGIPQIKLSLPDISIPFMGESEKKLLILFIPGMDAKLMNQWRDDLPNIQLLAEKGTWQELEPVAPVIPGYSWNAMTTGRVPIPTEKSSFDALNVLSKTPPIHIIISDTIASLSVQNSRNFWSVLEENDITTVQQDEEIEFDTTDLYEQFLQETNTRTSGIISALHENSAQCIFATWHSVLSLTQQNVPGTDDKHPLYDVERASIQVAEIKKMYVELDHTVQLILNAVKDANTCILLVSDQGLPTARYQVNVNTWLWQQGLLHFNEDFNINEIINQPQQEIVTAIDWNQTQVFSNGMGCVYIHFVDTDENSLISGVQWDTLKTTTLDALRQWRDHRWFTMNDLVVQSVFQNSIVNTPSPYQAGKQPDFQINFQPAYTVSSISRSGMIEPERDLIRNITHPSNTQTYHANPGILIANQTIIIPENPTVTMIAPAVYHYFSVDIPAHN